MERSAGRDTGGAGCAPKLVRRIGTKQRYWFSGQAAIFYVRVSLEMDAHFFEYLLSGCRVVEEKSLDLVALVLFQKFHLI